MPDETQSGASAPAVEPTVDAAAQAEAIASAAEREKARAEEMQAKRKEEYDALRDELKDLKDQIRSARKEEIAAGALAAASEGALAPAAIAAHQKRKGLQEQYRKAEAKLRKSHGSMFKSKVGGNHWAQAGLILVFGFFIYLFLSNAGLKQVGVWFMLFAFAGAVSRLWPQEGVIIALGAIIYLVLQYIGLLTPFNAGITVSLTLIALFYRMFPEFVEGIFRIVGLLFGGVFIFLLSAWLQFNLGIPWPHFITTALLILYMVGIFAWVGKKAGFIIFLINIMIFWPLFFTDIHLSILDPESPFVPAIEGQQEAWSVMFSGIGGLGAGIKEEVSRQYLIATGDYADSVEAQSTEDLGVFLRNVDVSPKFANKGDDISMFATLEARTFQEVGKQRLLYFNVSCYANGDLSETGVIVPDSAREFTVAQYESKDIDCIMDSGELGVGSHEITLQAFFDFVSGSSLKAYFMPQDNIRAAREKGEHPLDQFKIVDKDPFAYHSPGPVRIGIKVSQQPIPVVFEDASSTGPTLTITLENQWDGKLNGVKSFKVITPPGVVVSKIGGKDVSCIVRSDGGNDCALSSGNVAALFTKNALLDKIITTRAITVISPNKNDLFKGFPMALSSFSVEAEYEYILKKSARVVVKEVPVR